MIKTLFKQKCYIGLIFVLIVIEPSINSALNFWLQNIFNIAEPGGDKLSVLRLLTIGFFLWIFKRIITYISGLLKSRFICNIKQEIKQKMFANVLKADISDIVKSTSTGEYISLFVNDITLIEQRFFNQIVSLISGFFSIIILGAAFFTLNWKLAISILLFGIVAMFVPVVFTNKLNDANLRYLKVISDFTQKTKEYFVGYPTIKNYAIEDEIFDRFVRINEEVEDSKFEAEAALTLANSIGALLSWFMQFIGVGVGLMLVVNGEMHIGTVIAAQSFANDLGLPLQSIISSVNSIRSTKEIVRKIENTSFVKCDEKKLVDNARVTLDLQSDIGQSEDVIEFKDICLYMDGKTIIDQFTFKFKRNKKYLIIGFNGAGKSSLFKTLKKWFDNCEGEIHVCGQSIEAISNDALSQIVSYLNESVSLFSGSIRENISLFRLCAPEIFQEAINTAQIYLDLNRDDEYGNVLFGIEAMSWLSENSQIDILWEKIICKYEEDSVGNESINIYDRKNGIVVTVEMKDDTYVIKKIMGDVKEIEYP